MIVESNQESCFIDALRGYYPKPLISQKKGKKNSPATEPPNDSTNCRLLVLDQNRWTIVDVHTTFPSEKVLQNTLEKVVSLNFSFLKAFPDRDKALIETHLIYWIRHFNCAMMIQSFKRREIKPIEETEAVARFSSMHKGHAWLSNFFKTILYDPKNQLIYPSVENGYVVFKATKANLGHEEICHFASCLNPKEVKQMGAYLWERITPQQNQEAISEMSRLVFLKFQQNPFIAEWLKKSTARLQEFTRDAFWGSQLGTLPIEDQNSNHLGKILEWARSQLILSIDSSAIDL